jgi:hypothetical protein
VLAGVGAVVLWFVVIGEVIVVAECVEAPWPSAGPAMQIARTLAAMPVDMRFIEVLLVGGGVPPTAAQVTVRREALTLGSWDRSRSETDAQTLEPPQQFNAS